MRDRRNLIWLYISMVILAAAVLALLTWQNYRFTQNNSGGYDFLIQWMGARNFLTTGESPYSDATAEKIQTAAYGRLAREGESQLRYVYPLYAVGVFLPFALFSNFDLARAIFMTVQEVSLVVMLILSLRLTRWRPRIWVLGVFVLFSLFWFHAVRPVLDGNITVLVALLIVAGLLALKNGGQELAGLLFAFATIKPNVVVLLMVFAVIWGLTTRHNRFVGWLLGTVFLLSASSALLLPDWIVQNLREVILYPSYSAPGSLGTVLSKSFPAMGERIGRIIYGVMTGMLLAEWWVARKAEFRGFLWSALFTLTLNQWIGIPSSAQNFIILYPAVTLVFATWEERWRRAGTVLTGLSMILLFGGIWWLYLSTVIPGNPPHAWAAGVPGSALISDPHPLLGPLVGCASAQRLV
ncbi:MAG TPA: glycosyltransferase family 87 protein [Anaerolineaceae bacterium]|nr:glycosyltransferase family 87 protein [Anaerolineaceae bacterium]